MKTPTFPELLFIVGMLVVVASSIALAVGTTSIAKFVGLGVVLVGGFGLMALAQSKH